MDLLLKAFLQRHRLLIIFCLFPFLPACQTGYLVQSAIAQVKLLSAREPIDEAFKDPKVSAEQKRKLQLAQDAKHFAEEKLGLKHTRNYESFVQLKRPYVSYVVQAAYQNELKAYLWSYPLIGSLPYKGYDNPEDAKELALELKKQSLDVYVRGVSAYSTLGWFRDPILSSMLDYSDWDLVNTIIHETTHATLYIASEADFNERLATFIGNKGTEAFYRNREGDNSATLKKIALENSDELLFSEFITRELNLLEKWYHDRSAQKIDESERQARLKEIQTHFVAYIRPQLKLRGYSSFSDSEINNASLLNYKLYIGNLDDFDIAFNAFDGDFRKFIEACKTLEKSKNPVADLKNLGKKP